MKFGKVSLALLLSVAGCEAWSSLEMSSVGPGVGRPNIGRKTVTSTPPVSYTSDAASRTFANTRSTSDNRIWETSEPITVQGASLRTWPFATDRVERVQVSLATDGRPLNADVDLWHGPDNTPQKMRVYIEDGSVRPFNAVIETPRGHNTIAIRNTGFLEFPMAAVVQPDMDDSIRKPETGMPRIIQGGAVKTYPFQPAVESVQIQMRTDGRPLNARIELLQGPNNNKQVMEVYTEDGMDRPFYAIIETPGVGNVVRIVNTATVEFPITASVEPYKVGPGYEEPGMDNFNMRGGFTESQSRSSLQW